MASKNDLYDFNAPQHYFDFKVIINEEPDDSYFDCQDGNGAFKLETPLVDGAVSKALRSSSRHNLGTPKKLAMGTPKLTPRQTPRPIPAFAAVTPRRRVVPTATPKKPYTPAKIEVRAVEQSEDKENAPRTAENVPRTAENAPRTAENTPTFTEKKTEKKVKARSFSPGVGVRSSPRLGAIAKALRRSNAARRSGSAGARMSSNGDGANLSVVNKQKTQHKPSVPKVFGMQGLSEKDVAELETIATFKQKITKNRRNAVSATASTRNAVTVPHEFNFATDTRLRQKNTDEPDPAPSVAPVKKTLGPTRTQEFHFATDNRLKKQEQASEEQDAVAFPQFLRSGSSVVDKELPKGPTIPQPFNLTESRKDGGGSEVNKFVSVAELNLKFHTRTPQRFRSKRSDESDEANKGNKKSRQCSGVTIPVTPDFASRKTRSRQVSYLTREELEQKAFEEEQKHKFKANPVNKKIFEAPSGPNHQADRKQSTVPEPFNITKTKKEVAAPLGDNFKEMCNKLGCSTASIASLPWGGIPSKWDKTNTKLKPFSFDSRDKTKKERKTEMIQKVMEDEKKLAEFHAHPMPLFEDGIRGVPEKKPPTPTRSRPFNLRSDHRGEVKKEQIKRTLEEEDRLDKERRAFHATSDAILHKQPFMPEKSKKPLTDISGFSLNTEIRAEARTEYTMHQKMRGDELLATKMKREERVAAQEAAEVTRQRREAVHKANPVRNYKPVEIKPNPCQPTVPISPNLATKSRVRAKKSNTSSIESADATMDISSVTFTSESTFTSETTFTSE